MRAALALACLVSLTACEVTVNKGDESASEDDDGGKKKKKKKSKSKKPDPAPSAEPTTEPASSKTDSSGWKFVREGSPGGAGVDACAHTGGLGMACLDAYLEQKNEAQRRYMRLITDADARIAQDEFDAGQPGGVAHAEAAMFCAESGPCKQKNESGDEMDDGYACLTKAQAALYEGDQAASKLAHARTCKCDPKRAIIPVMGGTLACDGKDKPVSRGKLLTKERAKRVRACASCDATAGPAACAAEIDFFKSKDKEIADYLEKTHVPRCQKP